MAHPSSRARAIAARLLCAVVLSSCAHDVAGPARPTQLAFTTQPGTVVAGHAFNTAPRVEAEDANGHKVGSFTGNVTVALAHNPGGSTLAGTTTAATVEQRSNSRYSWDSSCEALTNARGSSRCTIAFTRAS